MICDFLRSVLGHFDLQNRLPYPTFRLCEPKLLKTGPNMLDISREETTCLKQGKHHENRT